MGTRHIFFVDSRVADYQSLLNSMPADSEWFLLDAHRDGIDQMQATLANYSALDSIQILSHGSPATLYLGTTVLTNINLATYSSPVGRIGISLTSSGDFLLYGCDVGQGEQGVQFITTLAQLRVYVVSCGTGGGFDVLSER